MNRIDWITSLAEKKPSPALVGALLVAVVSLFGLLVSRDRQYTEDIKEQAAEFRKELTASRKETKDCNDLQITRTDMLSDKLILVYQEQMNRKDRNDAQRAKNKDEKRRLIKKSEAAIDKIEQVNNQKDEN